MSNNVIEFPKSKVVREIPEEHLKARQAKADQKMAEAIVDDLVGLILTELDNCMINVENLQFSKDFILVVDALRASVYRQFDIEHHLHSFVDNNVTLIEGNMEGMSRDEIKEKIEQVMDELRKTKEKLETEPKEELDEDETT